MKRSKILADVDGVFANFIETALKILRPITGREHHHDDVDDHKLEATFALSHHEQIKLFEGLMQPGICHAIEPYPRAAELAARLAGLGQLYALTQPFVGIPTWDHERRLWCGRHMNLPPQRVYQIHSDEKPSIDGDWLIEDKAKTALAWMARSSLGRRRAIVLAKRYTRNEPEYAEFKRCADIEIDAVPLAERCYFVVGSLAAAVDIIELVEGAK